MAAASAAASPSAAAIKRGGTLKFGFNRDVQGFDPAAVTDSYVGFIFVGGLYDGLVNYTTDYQVGPGLAEKWEQPDDMTINFTLRQGVKFHDGELWNADAAKANLDRVIAANSKAKDKASLTAVASFTAISPTQLQVKLKSPDSVVMPLLGDYAGLMASPKAFDNLMTNPVGAGPMKFKSWDKGNRVSLVKNPDYWAKGADGSPLPYLDGFDYVIIPDLEQQINSLKTGQVNLLTIITGDTIDRIKGDSGLQ
jgi:ABC-type transport system substrate-binding protein